ncbi:hypothetical protein BD310DRAFT_940983 [Dichomitus squalens]|uniref:Uncharacterized protein n=1 Tax=Dichomitus squalens TaxID=114155 RepID=A0A4V2K6G1_9APHY|nr:hypothetical protein BD310DRAFT_940983 [Dichomitus squalens]
MSAHCLMDIRTDRRNGVARRQYAIALFCMARSRSREGDPVRGGTAGTVSARPIIHVLLALGFGTAASSPHYSVKQSSQSLGQRMAKLQIRDGRF